MYGTRKKDPTGKNYGFFLLEKLAFKMRNLIHYWSQSRHFFLKSGDFFPSYEKGQGKPPPLPL